MSEPSRSRTSTLPVANLRLCAVALAVLGACRPPLPNEAQLDVEHWGGPGDGPGLFARPRGIAVSESSLFVADRSGRIQVFDFDGNFVRDWALPDPEHGTPTNLLAGSLGNLVVPDTHNSRLLAYSPTGEELWRYGEYGEGEGQFCFVTAVAQAADGRWLIAEYGIADRIQVLSPERKFLYAFGEYGQGPGQFSRIMGMARGPEGNIYIADSVNHRIQVMTPDGDFVTQFGGQGTRLGQMIYPYDICYAPDHMLYVAEYGNHRIQKFTLDGRSKAVWGTVGNGRGQLWNPWGVRALPDGRIAVADADNHRITVVGQDGWYENVTDTPVETFNP